VSGFMPEADKFLWLDQFNWSDFGDLIVSLYRRNGYTVETVEADGMGLPCALVVCKGGKRTLLQCQPWNTGQVGVQAVRQLCARQLAAKAGCAVLIAS